MVLGHTNMKTNTRKLIVFLKTSDIYQIDTLSNFFYFGRFIKIVQIIAHTHILYCGVPTDKMARWTRLVMLIKNIYTTLRWKALYPQQGYTNWHNAVAEYLDYQIPRLKGAQRRWRYSSSKATFFEITRRHLAAITTFGHMGVRQI